MELRDFYEILVDIRDSLNKLIGEVKELKGCTVGIANDVSDCADLLDEERQPQCMIN